MMQRGRMVILGDAGKNLGDSMYDGTIYVGGKIAEPRRRLRRRRDDRARRQVAGAKAGAVRLEAPNGVDNMTKIVSGKQLWNYDNLEPTEKKLVL